MDYSQTLFATSFGHLLRFLRKRAHLTQRELAVLVGYSDAQINRYEKDMRTPDVSVVAARFIKALGLESDSEIAAKLISLAHQPTSSLTPAVAADSRHESYTHSKLPSPASSLFGREEDIQAVLEILSRTHARLLTLVGPPGVGKTRLAIQLAQTLETQFEHGAVFVPLAAVAHGGLIAGALLQVMGVASNIQNPLTQVKNVLHKHHMFLVLDNFEHLLDGSGTDVAANIVAELVTAAPHLKVLITSRAPLHLTGEHLYEVPSLAPASALDLFVSRAKAFSPTFNPRVADEEAIAEICQRLDYLPLAIELAAARIRLFEPSMLLKRLAVPLAFLTNGPQDMPNRQRTLRNAIDWSYHLLTLEEKKLFCRLSVFTDGCTMTMIEAIAGSDFTSLVVDLVQSLVDKSIVKAEFADGKMRFRLLEMLREYASELLNNSSEVELIAERSAQWFVSQVQTMQDDYAFSESAAWFEWFDAEVNNIRAIIQWSIHSGHIEYGLRLAAKLRVTWRLHGPLRDGFELVSQLLAASQTRKPEHLYAQVLLSGAFVADEMGNSPLSEVYLEEALSTFKRLGDKRFAAWALAQLGDHAVARAEYTTARVLLGESIEIFREVGDQKGLSLALLWFGTIERDQGNLQEALSIYEEVTSIARRIKSVVMTYLAAGWTAFVYQIIGDLDRAKILAEQALQICVSNGLTGSATIMLGTLGSIALFQGNIDEAIQRLDAAREGQERHGNPDLRAGTLVSLGFATHLKGDSTKAELMLNEALQVNWQCQRISAIPSNLIYLAWIAVDRQELARAACLMGAVAALNTQLSTSLSVCEQIFHQPRLQVIKAGLSHSVFEISWNKGQIMDCKAAIDYALNGKAKGAIEPTL